MPTPITTVKYKLRYGSPMPIINTSAAGCIISAPTSFVIQTFGVEVTNVDNYDAIIGLFGSEVMQGLQNYPEIDGDTGRPDSTEEEQFSTHAFSSLSYTGSNLRDTDGNLIFKGSESHSSRWIDEEDSGLTWL